MTREELDELWNDPKNWNSVVYRCAQDPRVIVPRRLIWTGWTLNFAHPLAGFALFLSILLAAGPTMMLALMGITSPPLLIVSVISTSL